MNKENTGKTLLREEGLLNRFQGADVQYILHSMEVASEREAMWLISECNEMIDASQEGSIDRKVFSVLLGILEEIHLGRGGRLPTKKEIEIAHQLGRVLALNYFGNKLSVEHQESKKDEIEEILYRESSQIPDKGH